MKYRVTGIVSFISCLAVISCLTMLNPAAASAADFSATMVTNTSNGSTSSKVFISGDKQRTEPLDEDSDGQGIVIVRRDRGVVWVLIPSEESYMEMPITEEYNTPLASKSKIVSREKLGEEKIEGRATLKELVTVKDEDGDTTKMYQWTDKKLGIPIKAEDKDGDWSYVYKDVETGKQDAALFVIPSGYEKMTMEFGRPDYPEPPSYPRHPSPPGPPDVPGPPDIPTPW